MEKHGKSLRSKLEGLYEEHREVLAYSENSVLLYEITQIAGNRGYSHTRRIEKINGKLAGANLSQADKDYLNSFLQTYYGHVHNTAKRGVERERSKKQIKNIVDVARGVKDLRHEIKDYRIGGEYHETEFEAWQNKIELLRKGNTRGSSIAYATFRQFKTRENAEGVLGKRYVERLLKLLNIEEIKAEQEAKDRTLSIRVAARVFAAGLGLIFFFGGMGAYNDIASGVKRGISRLAEVFLPPAIASEQNINEARVTQPITATEPARKANIKPVAQTINPKLVDVNYPVEVYVTANNKAPRDLSSFDLTGLEREIQALHLAER